jgi:hypothetical protein
MVQRRLISVGLLLIAYGVVWTPAAFAQLGSYSTYPTGGTISPWMNMFQKNPGPFDNYNSYVRPQLQLQKTLAQQNMAIQQQGRNLQSLGAQMVENDRENRIPVTGTGSVFMSYSHYYQGKGGGGSSASTARTPSRSAVASHASTSTPNSSSLISRASR